MPNILDRRELDLMKIFWEEERPLTHKDILQRTDKQVSNNAVYMQLNGLIEKGLIEVGPSVRCGRTYGRTFSATISVGDYTIEQLRHVVFADEDVLCKLIVQLLESDEMTNEGWDRLRVLLQKKRKELEAEQCCSSDG